MGMMLRNRKGRNIVKDNKKEEVNFDDMSYNELRTYASENDIDLGENTKKVEILAFLKEG